MMDAQGMEGGAANPGMKRETERADDFQLFVYLQGSQSRKMASIQTLKPENVSFSALFPSLSRGSPLASPENLLSSLLDDIHVTTSNGHTNN